MGRLYLWGLVSPIVLAQFLWIFNGLWEKSFVEPRRKKGKVKMCPVFAQIQAHECVCTCNHVFTRSPAAVGGESNSDKQLRCYKGGRESIKRDNKIAIEFLQLFIADACILVASIYPSYPSHSQGPCNVHVFHILHVYWLIHTCWMYEFQELAEFLELEQEH